MTTYIRAEITRWVSDDFPGFVECRFVDRHGTKWLVIDKVTVLTDLALRSDSRFPQPVLTACEVLARHRGDDGRKIADVTTERPWGIQAEGGTTDFQLHLEQLE